MREVLKKLIRVVGRGTQVEMENEATEIIKGTIEEVVERIKGRDGYRIVKYNDAIMVYSTLNGYLKTYAIKTI